MVLIAAFFYRILSLKARASSNSAKILSQHKMDLSLVKVLRGSGSSIAISDQGGR
jgi:hypothetical protein